MAKAKVDGLAANVGRCIASKRQDAGLTQEQVAEQLKIGNEAVSRMERGLVMPTVARLLELASLFNCDASSLLVESSNRPAEQAQHLAQMLARLDNADREMVLKMVEQLTNRLAKPS
ncbi:helix-turn-helix domain protein [Pseudogulbenkiania sp. NH8B]|uniref:helix-turn-helix domain-containing protein n=1 Tax=Pseudogulbenkiania sp. (strain NH8B) TaxID=748280 RepID=UPI0002279C58|nr:helix-turn-helix transcriptional regulator [Pseudogulbenkiania sp. NH8B]BAK77599.1 helix-turn-helix domain protein [Pseudogulbenkiania sp. NH8B]